jgi:hypothetical protein
MLAHRSIRLQDEELSCPAITDQQDSERTIERSVLVGSRPESNNSAPHRVQDEIISVIRSHTKINHARRGSLSQKTRPNRCADHEGKHLNRCFIPQACEWIAGTFAFRAFFIAVISCRSTVCTFDPIKFVGGNCVNAATSVFANGFATATICDPHVVTSAATLCATRYRQFSFHLLTIRAGTLTCSIRDAVRTFVMDS